MKIKKNFWAKLVPGIVFGAMLACSCISGAFAAEITINNASFEEFDLPPGGVQYGPPQGWTKSGGYDANMMTHAGDRAPRSGSQILKVTHNESILTNAPSEPIIGGAKYTFSFWHKLYSSGASSSAVILYAVADPGNPWANYQVLCEESTNLTNLSWQQFSYQFMAPSSVNDWKFYVWLRPTTSANVWSGFDGFSLATILPAITYGTQWVRNHPFPIYSWFMNDSSPNWTNLEACQNAYWGPLQFPGLLSDAAIRKLPRYVYTGQYAGGLTQGLINDINAGTAPDEHNGWYVFDEPTTAQLPQITPVINWLKTNRPNGMTYMSVRETGSSYLTQVINTGIDGMITSFYPFTGSSSESSYYFSWMTACRNATKAVGMPLFLWLQTFRSPDRDFRMPSESEFRMQVFTALASGIKGIGYFYWGPSSYQDPTILEGLVDSNGTPTSVHGYAASVKNEAIRLGSQLRFLDSKDIRFICGVGNTTPSGLTNWSVGAGADPYITAISIDSTGVKKDGFIGFFRDDHYRRYFMLTNLYRGYNLSAGAAALGFTITFNNSVNKIYRLSRETGESVEIPLTNNQLTVTLPGGTGDLYSYTPFVPMENLSIEDMVNISYQGRLFDSGRPINGTAYVKFDLFDVETGGSPVWSGTAGDVTATDGVFSKTIGPLFPNLFGDKSNLWLQVTVDGEIISQRAKLQAAPYAARTFTNAQ